MCPAANCILAGHSHIAAFGISVNTAGSQVALRELTHASGRFRIVAGEWPHGNAYWRGVVEASAGHVVALFWRGNQHLSRYLLEIDDRFDFVLASEPDLPLDESATILPEALVRNSFLPTLRGLGQVLRLLAQAGASTVVCGTPPPCGDDDWIRDAISKNRQWLTRRKGKAWLHELDANGQIEPHAIRLTARVIRYKLWVVLQALMREIAADYAVSFVATPWSAQTSDGFLRDEYRSDITHANQAYGALVLDDLWQRVVQMDHASTSSCAHASV
jgi:hypothetical protein